MMRRSSILIVVLAAARAAVADPVPPPRAKPAAVMAAPHAATKQLMARIGNGSAPILSMIDPAKGVWLFDGGQRHLCTSEALLDVAVEAQIHARTWGAQARCVNNKLDASCTLHGAVEAWPTYELRFDRSPSGLVLRALVRGSLEGKPIKLDATCTTPATLPVIPAPIVATVRRNEPDGHKTPTVATVAMLSHLAKGDWNIIDFADREHGLVVGEHPPDASGEGVNPVREARVCGAAIDPELAELRQRIANGLASVDKADAEVSCANQPATSECIISYVGEWGPVWHLHFRQTDHGLVLDALSVFDEHQVSLPNLEQHDILIAQALAHAAAEPCPP